MKVTENTFHVPVLLKESIELLALEPGMIAVDATAGAGGHSRSMAELVGESGTLVAIDADNEAIARVQKSLEGVLANTRFIVGNFRNIAAHIAEVGITRADAVLFDLGWSQFQIEDPQKGFSFQNDGPLAMRLDGKAEGTTAETIVNTWDETELVRILRDYGEERFARPIAQAIIASRPVISTKQLVGVIEEAVPKFYRRRKIHPATKTFQALRIAVNDELEALTEGLSGAWESLAPRGRIAVISFHSLEDRIVKRYFKEKAVAGDGMLITKKPIIPSDEEIQLNPRSRSAKLRVIQKNEISNV